MSMWIVQISLEKQRWPLLADAQTHASLLASLHWYSYYHFQWRWRKGLGSISQACLDPAEHVRTLPTMGDQPQQVLQSDFRCMMCTWEKHTAHGTRLRGPTHLRLSFLHLLPLQQVSYLPVRWAWNPGNVGTRANGSTRPILILEIVERFGKKLLSRGGEVGWRWEIVSTIKNLN